MWRGLLKGPAVAMLLLTTFASSPASSSEPVSRPSGSVDPAAVFGSYQRCSVFAVYQPALLPGYRLMGGIPQSCPDTPPEGLISVEYVGGRGSFTVYQDGAGARTIQRELQLRGWRSPVATVELASGPAKVYANCSSSRKRCRTADITRYGGGLLLTMPGTGNLTATDVLIDLPDRFGGKATMGLTGLTTVAESLQPVPRPSADSYTYYITDSASRPARWDRCTPIRYAINTASIPPGTKNALETIQRAIGEISSASGYTFEYVGDTSVIPVTADSPSWMTDQADVFIGFTSPAVVPNLAGPVAATTQHRTVQTADGSYRITGSGIAIDSTETLWLGFRSYGLGQVVLHELGHVLNLGHVDDPAQLMHPSLSYASPNHLQPGDIAGLTQLSAQPCFT